MNDTQFRGSFVAAMALGILSALPSSSLAEDYAPPNPQLAAQEDLPQHDAEAVLRGKSAVEHAKDLAAPSMMTRRMALQALIEMGPDALPARETVRFVAEHGNGGGSSNARDDDLRLGALSALHAMRAPESLDLLRAKIIDPDFAARDRSYAALLDAAGQVGIDDAVLTRDLLPLVVSDPDHAIRLMLLDALPPAVQGTLDQAIFESDHADRAVRHFIGRLPELLFMSNDERLVYALGNIEAAGLSDSQTREVLGGIGTDAALEAAIDMVPPDVASRFQVIAGFAEGPMTPQAVTAHLLEGIGMVEDEQQIGQGVSVLERMLRDDDAALFPQAMAQLIEAGPSATHRAVGAQRQVLFLQRKPQADAAEALRPVFALLRDPSAPPEARVAAATALRQSPSRLAAGDPGYFIGEAVDLIWPAVGPVDADLPMALLAPLMSSAELAPQVVDAIEDRFEEHLADWSINPATAIAIASGTTRGLERSPTREAAAIMMGKAIESPAIDLGYMGPHLARNGAALADLERNTVAGVIGTYAPTVFAEDKPDRYAFSMEAYMRPMLARPGWIAQDPGARAEWTTFLQRVVDLDDANFSPTARRALEGF